MYETAAPREPPPGIDSALDDVPRRPLEADVPAFEDAYVAALVDRIQPRPGPARLDAERDLGRRHVRPHPEQEPRHVHTRLDRLGREPEVRPAVGTDGPLRSRRQRHRAYSR